MKKQNLKFLRKNIYYDSQLDEYLIGEYCRKSPIPLSVCLEVTRACNFRCKHCSEVGSMNDMSTKNIVKIIDDLADNDIKRISISGGEPLMRKDLSEIIQIISDKKMIISLSTNGYLLNEEIIKKLKGRVANLRISLHGKEKFHDNFVGVNGAYKKVIQNIKLCAKHSVPVGLVCTVMQSNLSELVDVIEIGKEIAVNKITFYSLFNKGRAKEIFDTEKIAINTINQVLGQYKPNLNSKNSELCIKLVNWENGLRKSLIILPNGNLIASPFLEKSNLVYNIGNLLNDNFASLWKKFPFKQDYYAKHFSDTYY
ncbi:radical SAM protein [Candidatus Beckwithbacteria bacterium]|nr:radical SAM protein [Candidatus Beckwithbacteria bacterium]